MPLSTEKGGEISSSSLSSSSSSESTPTTTGKEVATAIVLLVVEAAITYGIAYGVISSVRWITRSIYEPSVNSQSLSRLRTILNRRGIRDFPTLSNYEQSIAEDVVDPQDLKTEFKDVGGLDTIKQELWQLAVLPLQRPDLFGNNALVQPPKGILLYGKPGTGYV
jgi:hypothetical protein